MSEKFTGLLPVFIAVFLQFDSLFFLHLSVSFASNANEREAKLRTYEVIDLRNMFPRFTCRCAALGNP